MSDLPFPRWQELICRALIESDSDRLEHKIRNALQTVEARSAELYADANHHEERLALEDATNLLKALLEAVEPRPRLSAKR